MKTRIRITLIKCGRCGKPYINPLAHVCVTRLDRPRRIRRPSLRPRIALDCPKCKKPLGNPLTHVCKVRTDFRRKLAAAKKRQATETRARARRAAAAKRKRQQAAKPAKPKHDYRACRDPDCQRQLCTAYRDGIAACPLSHEGGP